MREKAKDQKEAQKDAEKKKKTERNDDMPINHENGFPLSLQMEHTRLDTTTLVTILK